MTTSGALRKESKMTRTKAKRRKHYLWNIDDHLISFKKWRRRQQDQFKNSHCQLRGPHTVFWEWPKTSRFSPLSI